jgi:hypothetical protein
MISHHIILTQRLCSIPVGRIVTNALANSGWLVTLALNVIEKPWSKLRRCNLQRIMFQGNVARNTWVTGNTIKEIGLLGCQVIHLPIIGINIPNDDYK